MRRNGLSRRQKFIVVWMLVTVVAVFLALLVIVSREDPGLPLATVIARAARPTTTSPAETVGIAAAPTRTVPAIPESGQVPAEDSAEVLAARRIEQLGRSAGEVRELPKQQEIPLNFLDEEEMASYLRQLRSDSEGREFVERQQALLAALGLAPGSGEAFPEPVQTRAKHVVGFYDRTERQIFIGPAGRAAEEPDVSLIHQYAHALIDQHFDLQSFATGVFSADTIRARDALVEGDAMAVLALRGFGGLNRADLDGLAEHLSAAELTDYEGYLASRSMGQLVVFPYSEGARFVGALLEMGWWPAVNAVYRDPPVSTEQILHPEKYIENPRDDPRTVLLPDLREDLGEDWKLVTQDVLGELVLRAHLDQYLRDSEEAVAAADGWDGDLAALWEDLDGNQILVISSSWDTTGEAAAFARRYVDLIDRRLRGAERVRRAIVPPGGRWWRGDSENAYLRRQDDSVLIIWTPDTETMEQVLAVFVFDED
jgi:hypothetical protein